MVQGALERQPLSRCRDGNNALEWLDTAIGLRGSGLEFMKTGPVLDPLRKEPRFQAVMRELKFPD